jgi:hypothetical protein
MKYILILIVSVCSLGLFAQEHKKNEIGIDNSLVFVLNDNLYGYGYHIHYVRNISKFGIGFGYEKIFIEKHNIVSLFFSFKPIEKLSLGISPGISLDSGEPSLHFETGYEFEVGKICVGPVFTYAIDPEDQHMSLGVHIGYSF